MTTRTGRKTSKTHRGPSQATQDRQAQIELAVKTIDDDEPDFALFLARWADRYAERNLRRLWVQCPTATALHKFNTWRGMGRQVRRGEHAILLMQPRVDYDAEQVTPDNPNGEVFHGASWMALFDFAQTDPIGDYAEEAGPDADPDLVAEVKRLRMAAADLHPDRTGQDTAAQFMAAWARYEAAKARLTGATHA